MPFDKLNGKYVRMGFACFGVFAGLDGVMRLSSEQYRNSLGTTGILDSFNIGKVLFNILMTAFYGWVYAKMGEGRALSRLMLWHGLFYGVLGLGLCLPFVGMFLAQLTPIGLLLFATLMWTPFGYLGLLGVASTFVVFNAYLVWVALESNQSDRATG